MCGWCYLGGTEAPDVGCWAPGAGCLVWQQSGGDWPLVSVHTVSRSEAPLSPTVCTPDLAAQVLLLLGGCGQIMMKMALCSLSPAPGSPQRRTLHQGLLPSYVMQHGALLTPLLPWSAALPSECVWGDWVLGSVYQLVQEQSEDQWWDSWPDGYLSYHAAPLPLSCLGFTHSPGFPFQSQAPHGCISQCCSSLQLESLYPPVNVYEINISLHPCLSCYMPEFVVIAPGA